MQDPVSSQVLKILLKSLLKPHEGIIRILEAMVFPWSWFGRLRLRVPDKELLEITAPFASATAVLGVVVIATAASSKFGTGRPISWILVVWHTIFTFLSQVALALPLYASARLFRLERTSWIGSLSLVLASNAWTAPLYVTTLVVQSFWQNALSRCLPLEGDLFGCTHSWYEDLVGRAIIHGLKPVVMISEWALVLCIPTAFFLQYMMIRHAHKETGTGSLLSPLRSLGTVLVASILSMFSFSMVMGIYLFLQWYVL